MYSLRSPEILNRIPFWWFIVETYAVAQHTFICCLKFCYVMKFEGFLLVPPFEKVILPFGDYCF